MSLITKPDAAAGRQFVREALADCESLERPEMAAHVLAKIDDLQTALDVAAWALPIRIAASTTAAASLKVEEQLNGDNAGDLLDATPHRRPTVNPPRISAAATIYRRILHISEVCESGERRLLRDMTAADIRFAAASRRKQAAGLEAAAKRYDLLADKLEQLGVDTPAELDGELLVEVMAR